MPTFTNKIHVESILYGNFLVIHAKILGFIEYNEYDLQLCEY